MQKETRCVGFWHCLGSLGGMEGRGGSWALGSFSHGKLRHEAMGGGGGGGKPRKRNGDGNEERGQMLSERLF